jgi:pyruvate dehydrogenase E1 component alpha subunit
MDVVAVRQATDRLVDQARQKHEPSLLECVTYRYKGHSMSDPDTYRGKEEIKEWQGRDSILSLGEHLVRDNAASREELERIDQEVTAQVDEAVRFADESPEPNAAELYRDVYAEGTS